ncbi:MAG: Smr/MutS family protein [Saprospiraceae bacterium]|nr:Smr/MutS family protein [Saprospiraceae bacterium]
MDQKIVTLLPDTLKADLGFDKIIQYWMSYAVGQEAKNKIQNIEISYDQKLIGELLQSCSQLTEILKLTNLSIQEYQAISAELKYLRIENYSLKIEEIIAIRVVLNNVQSIHHTVMQNEWNHLDKILELAHRIPDLSFLILLMNRIILPDGSIYDKASDELYNIRKAISHKKSDVYRVFKKILGQLKSSNVLSEGEESIRNGRLVLRVNPEFKRKVEGIIHGESEKGKTIFIEPKELVELNNEIVELESDEKKEINKILAELCGKIRPHIEDIQQSYIQLIQWDLLISKSRLSMLFESTVPAITDNQNWGFQKARHPLLFLKLNEENKKIVSSDIHFDPQHRLIIVSGPNAGGKTILLKTCGLLQLMYQAGIPVPVDKHSKFKIFKKIFADIGDHQSLDDDLSTYSAKLKNMRDFDLQADQDTFILMDELGSGTEPIIGGALAESFLDSINHKKVYGIINTHYSNLKVFAHQQNGLQNAAMVFDEKNMSPTYRLQIGRPGGSFALEIAQKIKLPGHIIHAAKKKAGQQAVQFENLLTKLDKENQLLQKQIEEYKFKKNELDKLIKSYQDLHKQNEFKKLKLKLEQKQIDLQGSLVKQKEIDKFSKELRKEKELERLAKKSEDEKIKIKKQTEELLELNTQIISSQTKELNTVLEPGDSVKLILTGMVGKVTKIEKEKITVATDNMVFKLKRNEIVKIKPILNIKPERSIQSNVESTGKPFHPVLDMRGMRQLEAEQLLEQFIDKALMSNANKVHIIHGRGSGALKKSVLKALKHQNYVKQISHPEDDLGGESISIVEFQ